MPQRPRASPPDPRTFLVVLRAVEALPEERLHNAGDEAAVPGHDSLALREDGWRTAVRRHAGKVHLLPVDQANQPLVDLPRKAGVALRLHRRRRAPLQANLDEQPPVEAPAADEGVIIGECERKRH
eukprot:395903-Alexandrium_andersonii.AAC.1